MQNSLFFLNQISDELNKDLDLDNMLQRVIDLTVHHFTARNGSILLFDEAERVSKFILQNRQVSDARAQQIVGEVLTEGFAGWVFKHRRGDIIFDTLDDDRWYVYPNQPYTARSVIGVPLLRRNRILGILTLNHQEPGHFSQNDLPLLNAIAGQAAIALENAQLFYQTEVERTKLSAIINSTHDLIIVTEGAEQLVRLMNPAAEQAFGIAAHSWQDKPLAELEPSQALLNLFENGAVDEDPELQLPDGRTVLAGVVDVPSIGRLTLMRDVSALKALDKMKAEFITTFTHDLSAPLAAIKGYINFIKSEDNLTNQQLDDLDFISMSVDQIRTLIKDLLELTRIENIEKLVTVEISLAETLATTHERFQPVAEAKNVHLALELPPESPFKVAGNPSLIARAVDNLVDNAIKYSNAAGQVQLSLQMKHRWAEITVQDNGIGIPEKGLPFVFDKFYRAHAAGENQAPGSGLGLAIVKTIIERHGGRIAVESRVNEGSLFTVQLPLLEPVPA